MDGLFYTTLENQIREDDSKYLYFDYYETEEAARAKMYAVLSEAANSTCKYHSCHIMRSDGLIIDGHIFDRRAANV